MTPPDPTKRAKRETKKDARRGTASAGETGRTTKKGSRASTYTRAKAQAVMVRMMDGTSLRASCLKEGVAASTFATWVKRDVDGLRERYTRAQEIYALVLADECVDIADDSSWDRVSKIGRNGKERVALNYEHLRRVELQLAQRRWLVDKILSAARERQRDASCEPDTNWIAESLAALRRSATANA